MPKENTKAVNPLSEKFKESLTEIDSLEKQVNKFYQKIVGVSQTPELAKCLYPESTDSEKHLQRLRLIQASLGSMPSPNKINDLPQIPKFKKASPQQDLDIISYALKLQNLKLAHYELLHPIAHAMGLETESELIEQTITDNRNTNTWLRQIIQNIIGPSLQQTES
jgi:ferritin-like metal-binding protein YciE